VAVSGAAGAGRAGLSQALRARHKKSLDAAAVGTPLRRRLLALAVMGTIKEEVLPLEDLAPLLADLIQARGLGSHAFGDRPQPPEGTSSHSLERPA
jgi:hypothetical protein